MSSSTQHWIARRGTALQGSLAIPGDKSVSHRAVMFAALADGVSQIDGFLEGEDTRSTAAIFAKLGVRIETPSASQRIVHGVGVDGLQPPTESLGLWQCRHRHAPVSRLAGRTALRQRAGRR